MHAQVKPEYNFIIKQQIETPALPIFRKYQDVSADRFRIVTHYQKRRQTFG
jgi:hypothetical protein